jgi:REP element-mobilizing transposase RayT
MSISLKCSWSIDSKQVLGEHIHCINVCPHDVQVVGRINIIQISRPDITYLFIQFYKAK